MRQWFIATIICLLGVGLFALPFICGSEQQQTKAEGPIEPKTRILRIGLIPEQNIFAQKKRYEPLMAYLGKELGVSIEIRMLPRYGDVIEKFQELGLDGAFFGSFTGALAVAKLGLQPLARPEHMDGTSTYYGLVFAKKGRGLGNAAELRGKRMVFVDRATTAGYLLPLAYFRSLGIQDYRSWFAEYYFSGTHENAIKDVLDGYADIGAAKNTVFDRIAAGNPRFTSELGILATSPQVPSNALSVRSDLDGDLILSLKKELLAMHQSRGGRAVLAAMQMRRFVETRSEDYQTVRDYAHGIELDLAAYNYLDQ
jgi:phosphonate transport system substrate-binding protein